MSDVNKKIIRKLLASATIKIQDDSGSTHQVTRRVVRVIRKNVGATDKNA